jgi:hypothetical protein
MVQACDAEGRLPDTNRIWDLLAFEANTSHIDELVKLGLVARHRIGTIPILAIIDFASLDLELTLADHGLPPTPRRLQGVVTSRLAPLPRRGAADLAATYGQGGFSFGRSQSIADQLGRCRLNVTAQREREARRNLLSVLRFWVESFRKNFGRDYEPVAGDYKRVRDIVLAYGVAETQGAVTNCFATYERQKAAGLSPRVPTWWTMASKLNDFLGGGSEEQKQADELEELKRRS